MTNVSCLFLYLFIPLFSCLSINSVFTTTFPFLNSHSLIPFTHPACLASLIFFNTALLLCPPLLCLYQLIHVLASDLPSHVYSPSLLSSFLFFSSILLLFLFPHGRHPAACSGRVLGARVSPACQGLLG